jgi:hypothetical protein
MMVLQNLALTMPVTAYANSGGTGDRTASITVTATAPIIAFAGTLNNLVDGSMAADAAGSASPSGTATTGQYLRFQFGSKKYIDEIKVYYNIVPNNGSWKWQACDDASSWIDLATFTWDATLETVALTGMDFAGYLYYQMILTADHVLTNDWFQEVEFKIADGA